MEALTTLWDFFLPVQSNIYGLVFTLLAGLLAYFFRAKVKLIYGYANNSRNVVFSQVKDSSDLPSSTEIYVEKFFLQNTGKRVASDVDFVLSSAPTDVSIWQPRDVTYRAVEKGNCLIHIPRIAPGELVVIDCLYINQTAAWVTSVKCAECLGVEVPFFSVRKFPQLVYYGLAVLLALGMAFVIQVFLAILVS